MSNNEQGILDHLENVVFEEMTNPGLGFEVVVESVKRTERELAFTDIGSWALPRINFFSDSTFSEQAGMMFNTDKVTLTVFADVAVDMGDLKDTGEAIETLKADIRTQVRKHYQMGKHAYMSQVTEVQRVYSEGTAAIIRCTIEVRFLEELTRGTVTP